MVAAHALLVAHFEAVFALADLRDIEDPDQVPIIHANLAHLPQVSALLARVQMLLQKEVVVIELLFKDCGFANEVESEVAVAEDEELVVFVDALVDQSLPIVALHHIKHLVHNAPQDQQTTQFGFELQYRVLFVNFYRAVFTQQVEGWFANSPLDWGLQQVDFSWNEHWISGHAS